MSREKILRAKQQRKRHSRTYPYSPERLEKALQTFEKFKIYRNLDQYLGSPYNLRKRESRSANAMDLEIMDTDTNDANYRPRGESSRKDKKDKKDKQIQSSGTPQKLIVKIPVKSVKGWELLHRLVHIDAFAGYEDSDENSGSEQNDDDSCQQKEPSEEAVNKIRTAFAHPIDCELGNRCGVPCQFCDDFTFGMYGLGAKEVEVIDHGNFFEEVEGGHREDGHEQTRICNICSLERLRIMNCAGHEISPIPNKNSQTFDYGRAYKYLSLRADGKGRGRREQKDPWCSLCISPAFFRCATIHLVDMFVNDLDPASPKAVGCGLLLCQTCKVLVDTHHNDIGQVIAAIPGVDESVRADAEFLVAGSNLSRYFNE